MFGWDHSDAVPSVTAPRFCPRCRRVAPVATMLCAECGEALADQGYCDVCERSWPHRAGGPCPKHEIPLRDAAPPPRLVAGRRTQWVTIISYPRTTIAEAARIRLEAEGIPTFLEGERMGGHGEFQIATGGIRLQVPADLAQEARVILAQVWTPADGEDLEDAWEAFEPEPGAWRRSAMKAMIVLFLLLPAIQALIIALTW